VAKEKAMKNYLWAFSLVTWAAIGLGFQEPGPPAGTPKRGDVVDIGGLKSRVPADWVQETPDNAQCSKQFRVIPIDDDKAHTRITVCFAGKGKGQTAADYVKRWKGMFLPPEGKTIQEAAQIRKLTVNGAGATYLDIRGDYKGIPGDDASPRENFRMLAIYLSTPKGPYVIRVLGPNRTVQFYRKGFEDWVKALKS
jgi:hypothetical protein